MFSSGWARIPEEWLCPDAPGVEGADPLILYHCRSSDRPLYTRFSASMISCYSIPVFLSLFLFIPATSASTVTVWITVSRKKEVEITRYVWSPVGVIMTKIPVRTALTEVWTYSLHLAIPECTSTSWKCSNICLDMGRVSIIILPTCSLHVQYRSFG